MEPRYSPTQAYRPRRAPSTVEDRDACALYAAVSKQAQPTHEAIETALVALEKMLHRAGNVDGEGDGCGVLIDIPREIWAEAVREGGHASKLALDEHFAVAHIVQWTRSSRLRCLWMRSSPGIQPRRTSSVSRTD